MTTEKLGPEACTSMAQVREAIDPIDRQIIALLGTRFRYVEAAARIKQDAALVRDEARIAEVIENVCKAAREEGVPAHLAAQLYRQLIEASIAYELDRIRGKSASI